MFQVVDPLIIKLIIYLLNNFFKAKLKPQAFWLVDPPNTSDVRPPTSQDVLFNLLQKTRSRIKLSKASRAVIKERLIPFYQCGNLKIMTENGIVKKAHCLKSHVYVI